MLQFELPWAFALLPLPLLVYWLTPEFRDQGEALRAPFFARLVELSGREPSSGAVVLRKTWFQRTNAALCWCLIVVALARPVWAGEPITQQTASRDMLLLVDLSASMKEEDFTDAEGNRISRLEAVKQVLDEFITRREGDRLGLAVFGTAAFPQAPFTDDHQAVRGLLKELQPGMPGVRTMIGDAIGLAVKLFDASDKKNKVAILLTDGNDTGSKMPVGRAAEIAAEKGITIHTVAMGDPETVGEQALDLDVLQDIADVTGGKAFEALDRAELESIYDELNELELEQVDTLSYRPKYALFHYPVGGVVLLNILLAAAMILSRRRRQSAHGAAHA